VLAGKMGSWNQPARGLAGAAGRGPVHGHDVALDGVVKVESAGEALDLNPGR